MNGSGGVNGRAGTPASPRTQSHHGVGWNGRTLVFESGTYTGDIPGTGEGGERRETWTLQPNGELAIDIATSSSADRIHSVSATYRRRD